MGGYHCSLINFPDNNKGWKDQIFSIKYIWMMLVPRVWSVQFAKHVYPVKTRALNNASTKISSEFYNYYIFRTPEEYVATQLQVLKFDMEHEYLLEPASVTIAVPTPVSSLSNEGLIIPSFAKEIPT